MTIGELQRDVNHEDVKTSNRAFQGAHAGPHPQAAFTICLRQSLSLSAHRAVVDIRSIAFEGAMDHVRQAPREGPPVPPPASCPRRSRAGSAPVQGRRRRRRRCRNGSDEAAPAVPIAPTRMPAGVLLSL